MCVCVCGGGGGTGMVADVGWSTWSMLPRNFAEGRAAELAPADITARYLYV